MAVRIRLTRVGATKRPAYRVVAIDKRRARDGRALEILGFYDPLTEPATVNIDADRINDWIGKGAQPSETVVRLMRQAGIGSAGPTASSGKGGAAKRSAGTKGTKAAKGTKKGTKAASAETEGETAAVDTASSET